MPSRRVGLNFSQVCRYPLGSWPLGRFGDAGAAVRRQVAKRKFSVKVKSVCTELKVSRRTFDRWRALGTGPRCKRLAGNGTVRIRRSWLEQWLDTTDEDIA